MDEYLSMTFHDYERDWRGVTRDGNLVIVQSYAYEQEKAYAESGAFHDAWTGGYRDPHWWLIYRPLSCRVMSNAPVNTMTKPARKYPAWRGVLCLVLGHTYVGRLVVDGIEGRICKKCGKVP